MGDESNGSILERNGMQGSDADDWQVSESNTDLRAEDRRHDTSSGIHQLLYIF